MSTEWFVLFCGLAFGVGVGVGFGAGVGFCTGVGVGTGARGGSGGGSVVFTGGKRETNKSCVPPADKLTTLRSENRRLLCDLRRLSAENSTLLQQLDNSRITNRTLAKMVNRARNRNLLLSDDNECFGNSGFVVGGEYAIVRAASCEM